MMRIPCDWGDAGPSARAHFVRAVCVAFLAIAWCCSIPVSVAATHCSEEQRVVFSCAVAGGKLLSLCADLGSAEEIVGLRYRFGHPGSLELDFPETPADSLKRFSYAHYSRYQVDETEVSFRRRDHRYVVFSSYRGAEEGVAGAETRSSGVTVALPDGTEHRVRCETDSQNELWRLDGLLSCDPQSELDSGNCG